MGPSASRLAASIAVTALSFGLALFVPAGTIAWPAGWAFFALMMGGTIALSLWLRRYNPALLEERLTGIGKPDQEPWDRLLLTLLSIALVGWFVLIALDAARFRSSHVPLWLQGLGAGLLLVSFYVFYRTFRENPYLSPAVRIQEERGQRVITTGPSGWVRHPMYAGFVVFAARTTLLLGSWRGFPAGLLVVGLMAWRSVLEEETLTNELDGYTEYMRRVRYRLIPYVW